MKQRKPNFKKASQALDSYRGWTWKIEQYLPAVLDIASIGSVEASERLVRFIDGIAQQTSKDIREDRDLRAFLDRINQDSVLNGIRRVFTSKETDLRLEAFRCLVTIRGVDAVEDVISALCDDSERLQLDAISAAAALNTFDPELHAAVWDLFKASKESLRDRVLAPFFTSTSASRKWGPALLEMGASEADPEVRAAIIRRLNLFTPRPDTREKALELLDSSLQDSERAVQEAALDAISKIGTGPDDVYLRSHDERIRGAALLGLKRELNGRYSKDSVRSLLSIMNESESLEDRIWAHDQLHMAGNTWALGQHNTDTLVMYAEMSGRPALLLHALQKAEGDGVMHSLGILIDIVNNADGRYDTTTREAARKALGRTRAELQSRVEKADDLRRSAADHGQDDSITEYTIERYKLALRFAEGQE